MSKARDIANILSANTAIATDAEVTAAISAATSGLATASSVSTTVTGERTATATLTNKTIDGNLNVISVKRGTTAERPMTSALGDQYYDTTLNSLFNYTNAGWSKVSQDPAPLISSISPTVAPSTGTLITITGSDFRSGAVVQFIGTDSVIRVSPVVTFIAANSVTATTPQLPVAYEPYDVKVINMDNQFSVLDNALDAGAHPAWNTASGSLGSFTDGSSVSASVSATDPDGTSIVYLSTNLPAWLSLNSSTGGITGTSPTVVSQTTYSFDITASDGLNTSSRSFSVTVVPVVISGGTEVTSGGYKYHIFSSAGVSSLTVANGSKNVECLVVSGGGGAGSNRAGGGGGGGLNLSTQSLSAGQYKILVGEKGTKGFADSQKLPTPGGSSGIANSSSGYRYYRLNASSGSGFPTSSHYPRVSRIGITTEDGDTNVVVFTSDNSSDSGTIPAGDNYTYDFGSKKIAYGFYIYSTYGGGQRAGLTTIYGSNDNSNWTEIDSIITDNGTSTGIIRFYVKNSIPTFVLSTIGGGTSGLYNATFSDASGGSGGGGGANDSPRGLGTSGQGNNGGNGSGTGAGGSGSGGGGGGYSAAGADGNSSVNGGNGGAGWSIASGWNVLSVFSGMTTLSSGGGGGAPFGTPGTGGFGAGNGGSGSSSSASGNGTNATSFGSGGGGGAYGGGYSNGTGGDGFRGVVILRYPA